KEFLTLSPAFTQAAVEATNDAVGQEILSKTLLESPWTLLSILLVHNGLFHFLANMITFYFFGTAVERAMGGMKMLKIYLIAGIVSALGYIGFRNLLYYMFGAGYNGAALPPAVGASGAVIAMVGLTAMLYPEAEVLLYFVVPMKIKTAVKAFAALETFSLLTKLSGIYVPVLANLAASAHLTGLAVGLYFGYKLKDRYGRKSSVFNPMGY
ncbi:MAG: rhomboid family intramembrane serine protease, partial [Candidatus Nanohalobium sp.]